MNWFKQSAIAFDQLINAFIFFGYADETLSARAYRNREKKYWGVAYKYINTIFFWQENHCKGSFDREMNRKHLPREYQ